MAAGPPRRGPNRRLRPIAGKRAADRDAREGSVPGEAKFRRGVFISYSHRDARWLKEILTHLSPSIRAEKLFAWSDRGIKPGDDWREQIEQAIDRARVAVLLVTPDFLASEFIAKVELPRLLEARRKRGLIVLWIPVSASNYEATRLKEIQAASDPKRPLDALPRPGRQKALVEIVRRIQDAADVNRLGNALRIVDMFYSDSRSIFEGQPPKPPSVVAHQANDQVNIQRDGRVLEVISAADLKNLPPSQRKLIDAYEEEMRRLWDRWTERLPDRTARSPVTRDEAVEELKRIYKQICRLLGEVLDFLGSMGKQLHDHYGEVRFICTRSEAELGLTG
jgi:hypothetical protein